MSGTRRDLEHGTLGRLLDHAASRWPTAPAIEDGASTLSFGALREAVREVAGGLLARGLRPGDRVGLLGPNQWEWVVAALGVHTMGGVLVPLNTRFTGQEVVEVLERAQARHLFCAGPFLGAVPLDRVREAGWGGPVTVLRDTRPHPDDLATLRAAGAASPAHALDSVAAAVQPDHPCDLLFTSGTTGPPKGVPSTHAQTLRVYGDWADVVGLAATDRYLVVAPFFHSFGYKAGWVACLLTGATILPQAVFDAEAVLRRIAADRITVLPGPPALYQSLLALPGLRAHDLSSLRLAVTGAAVIPLELVLRMRDTLGFQRVVTGYGLTECTGVATMCRHDDPPEVIARTSGRPLPGMEVRVVDAAGRDVTAGSPGEVLVRGYHLMAGYDGDPEHTSEVLVDGWLRTGDVGVLDAAGNLAITDRIKDMVIVGGFNVYPAEVEHRLHTHPAIAEAAVVGMPDARLGEVTRAFVVLRAGHALDAADLIAWCRQHMANYKVPRAVTFLDALPRNASGKVTKHLLRARPPQPPP